MLLFAILFACIAVTTGWAIFDSKRNVYRPFRCALSVSGFVLLLWLMFLLQSQQGGFVSIASILVGGFLITGLVGIPCLIYYAIIAKPTSPVSTQSFDASYDHEATKPTEETGNPYQPPQ